MTDEEIAKMLTPEQIADGWKLHDGGPCPVEGPCELMFRNNPGVPVYQRSPEVEDWKHEPDDPDFDIIAYKE